MERAAGNDSAAGERIVPDEGTDRRCGDQARAGIFHTDNGGGDRGLHLGFFKGKVGFLHGAPDKLQTAAAAERLCADDAAVDEREAVGVPAEVLPAEGAVSDGDIFRMPEGILCIEGAAVKDSIPYILEAVLSDAVRAGEVQVRAAHEHVLAFKTAAVHGDIPEGPAEFRGLNIAAGKGNVPAFPERLDAVQAGILDADALGVPQGSAAELSHFGAADGEIPAVPEGIAQIEKGVLRGDAGAFLEGAFAVGGAVDAAAADSEIFCAVKGAFFVKGLIGDFLHGWVLSPENSLPVSFQRAIRGCFPKGSVSYGTEDNRGSRCGTAPREAQREAYPAGGKGSGAAPAAAGPESGECPPRYSRRPEGFGRGEYPPSCFFP